MRDFIEVGYGKCFRECSGILRNTYLVVFRYDVLRHNTYIDSNDKETKRELFVKGRGGGSTKTSEMVSETWPLSMKQKLVKTTVGREPKEISTDAIYALLEGRWITKRVRVRIVIRWMLKWKLGEFGRYWMGARKVDDQASCRRLWVEEIGHFRDEGCTYI